MCLVGVVYIGGRVLFFFFKQKTAYEMRISDWSSDVCSSDLMRKLRPARPDDPAGGQHMHEIGLHHVQQALVMGDEKHGLVRLAHDTVDAVADHPQRIDVEPAVEIGEASCRERGGQYV